MRCPLASSRRRRHSCSPSAALRAALLAAPASAGLALRTDLTPQIASDATTANWPGDKVSVDLPCGLGPNYFELSNGYVII